MEMISIIIPVYNAEHYIRRSLDSVVNQTFCQWEAICVNDGSTDASEVILKEYSGEDERIKVITQKNGGASVARNTGIRAAKGDYLLFLDSDDELCPDCLCQLWKEVERHPEVEMVIGAHESIDGNGASSIITYGEPEYLKGNEWVRFHAFKDEGSFYVVPWNKLIKKEILLNNHVFFKEGVIHEDDYWSFYLHKVLNTVSVLHDITYKHYCVPTSVMSTRSNQKSVESIYLILKDIIRDFDSPMRSLQVYKFLEYFRNLVLPYKPKKQSFLLYFSFWWELIRMKQFRLASLWFINWFHNYKHSRLYYQLIPVAYHEEVSKSLRQLNKSV